VPDYLDRPGQHVAPDGGDVEVHIAVQAARGLTLARDGQALALLGDHVMHRADQVVEPGPVVVRHGQLLAQVHLDGAVDRVLLQLVEVDPERGVVLHRHQRRIVVADGEDEADTLRALHQLRHGGMAVGEGGVQVQISPQITRSVAHIQHISPLNSVASSQWRGLSDY
jgi:hypothetical protein